MQSCVLCVYGKYRTGEVINDRCTECPQGKYTILQTGSTALSDCLTTRDLTTCVAGQYIGEEGVFNGEETTYYPKCRPCPETTFSIVAEYERNAFAADKYCTKCPYGTTSPDNFGLVGAVSCDCQIGFYRRSGDSYCTDCEANTFQALTAQTACASCTPGKYSFPAAGVCTDCPVGLFGDRLAEGCKECPRGKFGNVFGATSCQQCNACPDNTFRTNCTVVAEVQCNDSLASFQNPVWQDNEGRECAQYSAAGITPSCLVEGLQNLNRRGTAQRMCCVCGGGKNTLIIPRSLQAGAPIGTCVPCQPCTNANEVRVGCLSNIGQNNANGTCLPRDQVVQAPLCPRKTTFLGKDTVGNVAVQDAFLEQSDLGGYTFRELFGVEFYDAPFQCRRICDGKPRDDLAELDLRDQDPVPGRRDSGTCAGPFACNIAACTMVTTFEDQIFNKRTPRACPVLLQTSDAVSVFAAKQIQQCQDCATCGNPNLNPGFADYGAGCAAECTKLVCTEYNTIYDWTDGFPIYDRSLADNAIIERCKFCNELRDYRLCAGGGPGSESGPGSFAASDVSGNRPLMRFQGCTGKGDGVVAQYGSCEFCVIAQFTCLPMEYPSTCTADDNMCAQCLSRTQSGPQEQGMTSQGAFVDASGTPQILFCQVACVTGWTGVKDGAPALCQRRCAPEVVCQLIEFALPCIVPHDHRCVPRYPQLAVDDPRVQSSLGQGIIMLPGHANMLESGMDSSAMSASFENVFINLRANQKDLHQCVWNAVDVRDNDKTPGGVSYSFWPPARAYAFPLTTFGSKWCQWSLNGANTENTPWSAQAFLRNRDVQYPLLPLQNIVGSIAPRRILMNTSARAMRYCESLENNVCEGGYDGLGEGLVVAQQAVGRPAIPSARARVGDLFLGLEMQQARNATLLFVLSGRLLNLAWVPRWRLSYFARDVTAMDQPWVQARHFRTEVVALLKDSTPTAHMVPLNLILRAEAMQNTASLDLKLGGAQDSQLAVLWSSTQPVLVCKSNLSGGTVYVATSYDESAYIYTTAESTSVLMLPPELWLTFPGLVVGDPALRSGPLLKSTPRTPTSSASLVCLRAARRSSTCVAYYSSRSEIYCVHVNMSASVLFRYLAISTCPAGTGASDQCPTEAYITDFVVRETPGGDELLVRRAAAGIAFSRILMGGSSVNTQLVVTDLPAEITSDTRNILQYATDTLNNSNVVVVRCTLDCESIELCSDNFLNTTRIALFVDVSADAQTEVLALQTWTHENILLTVGPQGVILVVLVSPDSRWVWCVWYAATGKRLAMSFYRSLVETDLATLASPNALSSEWIGSNTVFLGKPGNSSWVCRASYELSLSEFLCAPSSPLQGQHFVRVLNGYVLQDPNTHGLQVLAQLRGMYAIEQGDCASLGSYTAAFHALVDRPQGMVGPVITLTLRRGPLYVTDGRAVKLSLLGDLNLLTKAPTQIYDSTGTLLSTSIVAKVTLLSPETTLGYSFAVECDCRIRAGVGDLRVGGLTITNDGLQQACFLKPSLPAKVQVQVQPQMVGLDMAYHVTVSGPASGEWVEVFSAVQSQGGNALMYLPEGCGATRPRLGIIADQFQGEVLGLAQWQHVQHTLSAALVHASTSIAVQFVRQVTDECPLEDGVPGDCFINHDVLGLDAVELLIDLVLPGRGGRAGWTEFPVHIPSKAELDGPELPEARQGSDITDWERLHVTVGVRRDGPGDATCPYRVRILPRGTISAVVLPQLGCSIALGAGLNYSECGMEIPISATQDGSARLNLSLAVGAPLTCPDPALLVWSVVLPAMNTLYTCGSNEFWSEDTSQCLSCDTPGVSGAPQVSLSCAPGQYVHGCDQLQSEEYVICLPCARPSAEDGSEVTLAMWNQTAFWGTGICNISCLAGHYQTPDQRCIACTTFLINTCSRSAGSQWQRCTETENEQCVPCPAIQKGLQSRFEEFVPNNFTACVTRCLPRHYRASTPPYACFPCSSYVNLLRLTSIESVGAPYFRFQECSAAADTMRVVCEEQDNNIITGQALAIGEDCPRSCDVGTQLMQSNMQLATVTVYAQTFLDFLQQVYTPPTYFHTWRLFSCAVCEAVVAPGGADLPMLAYTLLPFCDYECNQSMGFYRRNGSRTPSARECSYCGTSSSSVCGIGQYPVGYNCSICVDCSLPITADGWQFTSGGIVDEPTSCEKQCMSGMFADFDVCKLYSNVSCLVGEYLLKGTFTSDNFCAECVSCEGQRRVRNCSETVNGLCRSCGEVFGGQVFVGENCSGVCVGASVLDVRTGICEICRFECLPGTKVAVNRQNCTHCEACPLQIPKGAVYVGGCSWTCQDGLVVQNGSQLTCQALPRIATRDPRAASLRAIALPTCPLGQEVQATSYTSARCVPCNVVTPADPGTFTWSSMGLACEWTCLEGLLKFFQQTASGERVECLTLTQFRAQTPVIVEVSSSAGVRISSSYLSYFAVFLVFLMCFIIS